MERKIEAEMIEMEMKTTKQEINKIKSWYLKKNK